MVEVERDELPTRGVLVLAESADLSITCLTPKSKKALAFLLEP